MCSILGPAQWVKGSGVATAAASVAGRVQIQSLAQELTYVMYVAIRKVFFFNLEWLNNEVLLYNTQNCIQFLGIEHDGRVYEKKNMYMTGS